MSKRRRAAPADIEERGSSRMAEAELDTAGMVEMWSRAKRGRYSAAFHDLLQASGKGGAQLGVGGVAGDAAPTTEVRHRPESSICRPASPTTPQDGSRDDEQQSSHPSSPPSTAGHHLPEDDEPNAEQDRRQNQEDAAFHTQAAQQTDEFAKERECKLRAVWWCLNYAANNKSFNKISEINPDVQLPFPYNLSHWQLVTWLEREGEVQATYIDCCINGCQAYTGDKADEDICRESRCKEPRYRPDTGPPGSTRRIPRNRYCYLSPISRLQSIYANKTFCKILEEFRSRRAHWDDAYLHDMHSGNHFKDLQRKPVRWDGEIQQPECNHFAQETDIPLSLTTDGVTLFKQSRLDMWPLILTNYALPPEIRTRMENIICVGLIPGTSDEEVRKTVDIDSFLYPLLQDLRKLAVEGVASRRWVGDELVDFRLKAHLVLVGGDMPAVAKLMLFKSINAMVPCRWCTIKAIPLQRPKGVTYYLARKPTDWHAIPERPEVLDINYSALPCRTDENVKAAIAEMENPRLNGVQRKNVEQIHGINGRSILHSIGSVDFVKSFPVDAMHLLFENVVKQLLECWGGKYKTEIVKGKRTINTQDPFVIPEKAGGWKDIDTIMSASIKLIPSAMSRTLTSISNRRSWTAETYSFFLLTLGPAIMKEYLKPDYFEHFVKLSEIAKIMLSVRISVEDVGKVEVGLRKWVEEFDQLYFRFETRRLNYCTNPVHSLLHVAECIRTAGPLTYYWCFAMERYCGWLKRKAKRNRVDTVTALINLVKSREQIFRLVSTLPDPKKCLLMMGSRPEDFDVDGTELSGKWLPSTTGYACKPSGRLTDVQQTAISMTRIQKAIQTYLTGMQYTDQEMHGRRLAMVDLRKVKELSLTFWNSLEVHPDYGAHRYRCCRLGASEKARDRSWIKYEQQVDRHAHRRTIDSNFQSEDRFGRIHVFVDFRWNETFHLCAIVQPSNTTKWIDNSRSVVTNPPLKIVGEVAQWQVVDVRGILAPAARLWMPKLGKHVVFEASNGGIRPEYVDDERDDDQEGARGE